MLERKLRYGENPHQSARVSVDEEYQGPTVLSEPLYGKPLSYNNILDANAALEVMLDLAETPAAVVIKHGNPCGLATGEDLAAAFTNAWSGDEISAFGSVIGFSQEVDVRTIKRTKGRFVEAVVAPSYSPEALAWIKGNKAKADLRVIAAGPLENAPLFEQQRSIRGGTISQTEDKRLHLAESLEALIHEAKELTEPNSETKYKVGHVAGNYFSDTATGLVKFATIAGKHTKSNAIVIAYEYGMDVEGQRFYRVLGMGAGQPNRLDSAEKLALTKARENLAREYLRKEKRDYETTIQRMTTDPQFADRIAQGIKDYTRATLSSHRVVLFSDAFFPFRDGLVAVADAGVKYVVQPGGSKGDEDVIQAAKEYGMSMLFTGVRHFKH